MVVLKVAVIGKDIKKVTTFFNKVITDKEKDGLVITIDRYENSLLFYSETESGKFGYILKCDIKGEVYKTKIFFSSLKNILKKYKQKDNIILELRNNQLKFNNDNGEENSCECLSINKSKDIIKLTDCPITVSKDLLSRAMDFNKVIAKQYDVDFCKKVYFDITNDTLIIKNINGISSIINKIAIKNSFKKLNLFAVNNNYISFICKWISTVKEDLLEISIINNKLYLKTESEFLFLPILQGEDIRHVCFCLSCFYKLNIDSKNFINLNTVKDEILSDIKETTNTDDKIYIIKKEFFETKKDISVSKSTFANLIKGVTEYTKGGFLKSSTYTPFILTEEYDDHNFQVIFNIIQ